MSERTALLAAAVLAAVVYAGTFGADYTLDDVEIVRENPVVHRGDPAEILTTDYWAAYEYADHTLYRPVTIGTYALQRAVHGASPAGYHVVNVALHALVTWLVGWLTAGLFRVKWAGVVAALLFAVHPVHVEAVAGIVGRAEILALGGTLLATGAWFRAGRGERRARGKSGGPRFPVGTAWGAAAVAAVAVGAGSKETGVLAPVVILATEALLPAGRRLLVRRPSRAAVITFVAILLVLAGYVALRAGAVSGRSVNAAMVSLTAGERMLTSLRILGENVGLLFFPATLSADYPASAVPAARGVADPGVLSGIVLVFLGAFLVFRFRKTLPASAWGALLFALTYFPVSNFAFAIGVPRADRLLYAPSAGFVIAAAGLLFPWLASPRVRPVVLGAAAIIAAGFGAMTWRAAGAWKNDCTLAEATLAVVPESPQFLTRRAVCRLDAGDPDGARRDLDEALRVEPDYPTALLYRGVLEREQGNLDAAIVWLDRLLQREPRHAEALEHASWIHFRKQQWPEAAAAAEVLRSVRPGDPAPVALLIGAYAASGRLDEAESVAAAGLARFPGDPSIRRNAQLLAEIRAGD